MLLASRGEWWRSIQRNWIMVSLLAFLAPLPVLGVRAESSRLMALQVPRTLSARHRVTSRKARWVGGLLGSNNPPWTTSPRFSPPLPAPSRPPGPPCLQPEKGHRASLEEAYGAGRLGAPAIPLNTRKPSFPLSLYDQSMALSECVSVGWPKDGGRG
jgi:hypothetical protein